MKLIITVKIGRHIYVRAYLDICWYALFDFLDLHTKFLSNATLGKIQKSGLEWLEFLAKSGFQTDIKEQNYFFFGINQVVFPKEGTISCLNLVLDIVLMFFLVPVSGRQSWG